jgi:membrane protein implicated in regulation of membrane protease activity
VAKGPGIFFSEVKALSVLRFLPGLIIVQVATAALVIHAVGSSFEATWQLIGVVAIVLTLVVAFWFRSIAHHIKKDSLAQAKEAFSLERERLILASEAEKRTIVEESHQRIVKETNQAHARANFKLGAVFVGILCVATVMLYVELITLGLVVLATGGGALAGYVARARQDSLANKKRAAQAALAQPYELKLIKGETIVEPTPPGLKRDRREK